MHDLVIFAVDVGIRDRIDVHDVGHGDGGVGQGLVDDGGGVIGLFVLTPGHAADMAFVVQIDALATVADDGVGQSGVIDKRLIDLGVFGIGNRRAVAAVVGFDHVGVVVEFQIGLKIVEGERFIGDACFQRRGIAFVVDTILIHLFKTVAQRQFGVATGQRGSNGVGRLSGEGLA